ncbi:MAG: hypothetical protein ACI4IE_02270 [Eubacterium sp.]
MNLKNIFGKKSKVNYDEQIKTSNEKTYTLDRVLDYIKCAVNSDSSLEEIVSVFENACKMKINDDCALFETGTFSFTGEELFYFSLVKQFENEDDEDGEYVQIHIDVMFEPTKENAKFSSSIWFDEPNDILTQITKSKAFQYLKDKKISKLEIYADET